MISKYTVEYLSFRERLSTSQMLNLKYEISIRIHQNSVPENALTVAELGADVLFNIYVDRNHDILWFLGGHWVREGEPSDTFLKRMKYYTTEIIQGREPR